MMEADFEQQLRDYTLIINKPDGKQKRKLIESFKNRHQLSFEQFLERIKDKRILFEKNPDIDFLIVHTQAKHIPTKQDGFIALKDFDMIAHREGDEIYVYPLEEGEELYTRRKDKNSLKEFTEVFQELIQGQLTNEHPYKRNVKLEVIISIQTDLSRIKEVDIDNQVKAILDCLNGLVYEDDSQIVNILARKETNLANSITQAVSVGVRKINDNSDSMFKDMWLWRLKGLE